MSQFQFLIGQTVIAIFQIQKEENFNLKSRKVENLSRFVKIELMNVSFMLD